MDTATIEKLAVLLMSAAVEGYSAMNTLLLAQSQTEKAAGFAAALRRCIGGRSHYKVFLVLSAQDGQEGPLSSSESEWALTLATAIRQAMRKQGIDPSRGDKINHPLVPHLLRRWGGLDTVVN